MNWYFLNTGENTGKYNMDFDEQLARQSDTNDVYLRLYQWKPYCISLGANQSVSDINVEKANDDRIDIVKRPTGGRAILHSEEITYSVIYPINNFNSPKQIYREINLALKRSLINYSSELESIELEHTQPDFRNHYKTDISSICFAVSAQSELNFNGKKIVGSAQRKLGNIILQHGSILCGDHHKKIIDYLPFPNSNRSNVKNEIDNTTTDLKTALNYEIDFNKLIASIKKGFEDHFEIIFKDTDIHFMEEKLFSHSISAIDN